MIWILDPKTRARAQESTRRTPKKPTVLLQRVRQSYLQPRHLESFLTKNSRFTRMLEVKRNFLIKDKFSIITIKD